MRTRRMREIPAPLEGIRRRFDRWRSTRNGCSRIPEGLCASAVKAARQYGLCRTMQVLRLDYYSLKQRVEAAHREPSERTGTSHGAAERKPVVPFVELTPAVSCGSGECLLELDDPGGAKMRVHLKGVEAPDLAALSRSFWSIEA